jgi:TPR repeat protein
MAAGYAARAAEAGSAEAQRTLGFMYHRGIGVEQDSGRAAELWTEASPGGDGYAAFNLAGLHRKGEVLLSGEEAISCWFSLPNGGHRGWSGAR